MPFALIDNGTAIEQTGNDVGLEGLVGNAGITTLDLGARKLLLAATEITEIRFHGNVEWNPDQYCIIGNTDTRFKIGDNVNDYTFTWRGDGYTPTLPGIICNRMWNGSDWTRNPSNNNNNANRYIQFLNFGTVRLTGGAIQTTGLIFIGTNTQAANNWIDLEFKDVSLISTNENTDSEQGHSIHLIRAFINLNNGIFTDHPRGGSNYVLDNIRINSFSGIDPNSNYPPASLFSRSGYTKLSFILDRGSLSIDGNKLEEATKEAEILHLRGGNTENNLSPYDLFRNGISDASKMKTVHIYGHNHGPGASLNGQVARLPAFFSADLYRGIGFKVRTLADQSAIENAKIQTITNPAPISGITGSIYRQDYDQIKTYNWTTDNQGNTPTTDVLYGWVYNDGGANNETFMANLSSTGDDDFTQEFKIRHFNYLEKTLTVPMRKGEHPDGLIVEDLLSVDSFVSGTEAEADAISGAEIIKRNGFRWVDYDQIYWANDIFSTATGGDQNAIIKQSFTTSNVAGANGHQSSNGVLLEIGGATSGYCLYFSGGALNLIAGTGTNPIITFPPETLQAGTLYHAITRIRINNSITLDLFDDFGNPVSSQNVAWLEARWHGDGGGGVGMINGTSRSGLVDNYDEVQDSFLWGGDPDREVYTVDEMPEVNINGYVDLEQVAKKFKSVYVKHENFDLNEQIDLIQGRLVFGFYFLKVLEGGHFHGAPGYDKIDVSNRGADFIGTDHLEELILTAGRYDHIPHEIEETVTFDTSRGDIDLVFTEGGDYTIDGVITGNNSIRFEILTREQVNVATSLDLSRIVNGNSDPANRVRGSLGAVLFSRKGILHYSHSDLQTGRQVLIYDADLYTSSRNRGEVLGSGTVTTAGQITIEFTYETAVRFTCIGVSGNDANDVVISKRDFVLTNGEATISEEGSGIQINEIFNISKEVQVQVNKLQFDDQSRVLPQPIVQAEFDTLMLGTNTSIGAVAGQVGEIKQVVDDKLDKKISDVNFELWVDTTKTENGDGSRKSPFNDLGSCLDKVSELRVHSPCIYLYGDEGTLELDRFVHGYKFYGATPLHSHLNINNKFIKHCHFENLHIYGDIFGASNITAERCMLSHEDETKKLNNVWGDFVDCEIVGALEFVGTSNSSLRLRSSFMNCYANKPNFEDIQFYFGGVKNVNILFHMGSGKFKINDLNDTNSFINLTGVDCHYTFGSGNTAGNIEYYNTDVDLTNTDNLTINEASKLFIGEMTQSQFDTLMGGTTETIQELYKGSVTATDITNITNSVRADIERDSGLVRGIKTETDRLNFDAENKVLIRPFTQAEFNSLILATNNKIDALNIPTAAEIGQSVEAAIINEEDGKAVINAIVTRIDNENIVQEVFVAAIRADIEREGGLIDTIKKKTDGLTYTSEGDLVTQATAIVQSEFNAFMQNLPDSIKETFKANSFSLDDTETNKIVDSILDAPYGTRTDGGGLAEGTLGEHWWFFNPDEIVRRLLTQVLNGIVNPTRFQPLPGVYGEGTFGDALRKILDNNTKITDANSTLAELKTLLENQDPAGLTPEQQVALDSIKTTVEAIPHVDEQEITSRLETLLTELRAVLPTVTPETPPDNTAGGSVTFIQGDTGNVAFGTSITSIEGDLFFSVGIDVGDLIHEVFEVPASFTATDSGGTITATIPAEKTARLRFGTNYKFEISNTKTDGTKTRVAFGDVIIKKSVA